MQQDAQRVAAAGRHRGLRARGRVHVGGERGGQRRAAGHVADELAVVPADEQRVVAEPREGPVGAEVE